MLIKENKTKKSRAFVFIVFLSGFKIIVFFFISKISMIENMSETNFSFPAGILMTVVF